MIDLASTGDGLTAGLGAAGAVGSGGILAALITSGIGLVGAGILLDRAGRRSGILRRSRRAALWTGLIALTLALSPPVDALAHTSFLWHMLQHLVLILVAAPALVTARTDLIVVRALPRRLRDRTARMLAATLPRGLSASVLGLGSFVGWLWVTHLTSIYDRTLDWPLLHGAEHILYLLTAMAFWIPFVRRISRNEVVRIVTPLVFVLIAMPATSTLTLVLLIAEEPRYAAYSLTDQRAGAMAMWIGMGVGMLGAGLMAIGRAMPTRTRPKASDGQTCSGSSISNPIRADSRNTRR